MNEENVRECEMCAAKIPDDCNLCDDCAADVMLYMEKRDALHGVKFYDPDGKPYEGTQHEIMMKVMRDALDPTKKIVKQDHLDNGIFISTVWIEAAIAWKQPPLIYETMVFLTGNLKIAMLLENAGILDCTRYATREQADRGHTAMLEKWINWKPEEQKK